MKYKGDNILIAQIDSEGNLIPNKENLQKIDPENILG
jgi:hypothetical protein